MNKRTLKPFAVNLAVAGIVIGTGIAIIGLTLTSLPIVGIGIIPVILATYVL